MDIDQMKDQARDMGDQAKDQLDDMADQAKSKIDDVSQDIRQRGNLGGEKQHSDDTDDLNHPM